MPSVFRLENTDIAGKNYEALLKASLLRFDSFSLVWRSALPYVASRHAIGRHLLYHQISKKREKILYRLDAEALPVLRQPDSLFRWRFPDYPEDLVFYRNAQPGFVSVSHEAMAWILDAEFARSLPRNLGFTEHVVSERAFRQYAITDDDKGSK